MQVLIPDFVFVVFVFCSFVSVSWIFEKFDGSVLPVEMFLWTRHL